MLLKNMSFLLMNCEDGMFNVQRYDKDKTFDNTNREVIHYSNLIVVKDSQKKGIANEV